MPGQITETLNLTLRTVRVEAQFSAADEANLGANAGQWGEGYVPSTVLRLTSRDSEDPSSRPQTITASGAGLEGEALDDYKAAVREFFLMPNAHAFVGKIFRGTAGYADTQGEGGITGANAWRSRWAGAEYDMHDGSGSFTVTAPEVE